MRLRGSASSSSWRRRTDDRGISGYYPTLFSIIKQHLPGTPLCPEGEPFCQFNNRFWVHQKYVSPEPVWRDGNTVFCNGWVLPQYLIRDGFLEV
ncbi:MAG TPA: hypothetical protein ENN52_04955 [Methanofollis liminatans]|uniref:Uncharacterized protein n=1 Tax=Methanofollis liminatans TaxID=2201 RepID=A0A831LS03_9EURY|nr:hypothetical protein [Methanofollis liminatans]